MYCAHAQSESNPLSVSVIICPIHAFHMIMSTLQTSVQLNYPTSQMRLVVSKRKCLSTQESEAYRWCSGPDHPYNHGTVINLSDSILYCSKTKPGTYSFVLKNVCV